MFRGGVNAHMISFPDYWENVSSCFLVPLVLPCLIRIGVSFNLDMGVQIRDHDSALLVAQLLFLEAEESQKPIHLYINSPGGQVTAGMAIYDTVSTCLFFGSLVSYEVWSQLTTISMQMQVWNLHSFLFFPFPWNAYLLLGYFNSISTSHHLSTLTVSAKRVLWVVYYLLPVSSEIPFIYQLFYLGD